MRKKEKASLREELMQMPMEQLDEMLIAELQKEHPDEDRARLILKVLEEREIDNPVEITEEIWAAWEKYQRAVEASREVEPSKPAKSRKWVVGVAAAAAALLVVMFIPRTVGAESVFQVLCRWTKDTFEFLSPGEAQVDTKGEYVFKTDNPGLQQVYEKVVELGVTDPVVPMWLPEGYVLTELNAAPTPDGERIYASFSGEAGLISLSYFVTSNAVSTQHEWEEAFEEYEVEGVSHVIVANKDGRTVTWIADNVECSIVSCLDADETYKMIKSIYRRNP